jgi:hypothetical protein
MANPVEFHHRDGGQGITDANLEGPQDDLFNYFNADEPEDPDLMNENEIVLWSPIYITNDEKHGLYYKINTPKSGLTRRELVRLISKWLILRNIYYNIEYYRKKGMDVNENFEFSQYASGLVVHSIRPSGKQRSGLDVYNIDLSS